MADKKIHFISSVQAKVIFITIFIITLILGAYAMYDFNRKQALLDSELKELAKITATKLVNNLRIPLWNLDSELVTDTIEAEMLTRDISGIIVYDSEGFKVFSGKQRDDSWGVVELSQLTALNKDLDHQVKIKHKSESIGAVKVYVTDKFKQEQLSESVKSVLIALIVLDITIFLVLWVVMHNFLTRPIQKLSESADQISRGKFSSDMKTERNDEIGVMAHSVDRIQISLRIAMEKLGHLSQQHKALINKVKKSNG